MGELVPFQGQIVSRRISNAELDLLANERRRVQLTQFRLDNGMALRDRVADKIVEYHHWAAVQARGDDALLMELREFGSLMNLAAAKLIRAYMVE